MPEQETSLVVPSEKDIAKAKKKFERWCDAFLDPKSNTYGNATKSALAVYKTKKYHSAGQIGHENLKKLERLALVFSENNGVTAQDWFKIAASKAVSGSYEQTVDYMQRLGILEKPTNVPSNQVNQQFNFGDLAETFTQARKERGLSIPPTQSGSPTSNGSPD